MNRPRDNRTQIVRTAVAGRIAPARFHTETLNIDRNGRLTLLPGSGGINLDVHCGDPVDQWLADHLMVGASIEDAESLPASPGALHLLACLGNTVRDAAGRTIGVVAGKRGGLAPDFFPPNLVAVEMPDTVAELLKPSDRVSLRPWPRLGSDGSHGTCPGKPVAIIACCHAIARGAGSTRRGRDGNPTCTCCRCRAGF
jgi:hypothetical protein